MSKVNELLNEELSRQLEHLSTMDDADDAKVRVIKEQLIPLLEAKHAEDKLVSDDDDKFVSRNLKARELDLKERELELKELELKNQESERTKDIVKKCLEVGAGLVTTGATLGAIVACHNVDLEFEKTGYIVTQTAKNSLNSVKLPSLLGLLK